MRQGSEAMLCFVHENWPGTGSAAAGFREVWKDLLFGTANFGVSDFSDISQLYCIMTPSLYFLMRISPEMETQLGFMPTFVKFGSQKSYRTWFAGRHLCWPGSETVVVDIGRLICCVLRPPNEIIRSDVISRWAVIGWLFKCCRKNYFEANVKLALLYIAFIYFKTLS